MADTELATQRARAVLRYYRMSPTKAREVLDLIRGKSAVEAIQVLSLVNREASEVVGKLLASAVANATVRFGLGANEVYVARAFADEGPTLKRFRPRARGRATRIRKRSCHITIEVEEMPLEMRRQQAARTSNRQAARRAQRVASSRRAAQGAAVARELTATAEAPSAQAPVEPAAVEQASPEEAVLEASAVETTEVDPGPVVQGESSEGAALSEGSQSATEPEGPEDAVETDEERGDS
jgi:large subunit ribosomal protein L22